MFPYALLSMPGDGYSRSPHIKPQAIPCAMWVVTERHKKVGSHPVSSYLILPHPTSSQRWASLCEQTASNVGNYAVRPLESNRRYTTDTQGLVVTQARPLCDAIPHMRTISASAGIDGTGPGQRASRCGQLSPALASLSPLPIEFYITIVLSWLCRGRQAACPLHRSRPMDPDHGCV